jgi:ABC-2 type transport system permease protein
VIYESQGASTIGGYTFGGMMLYYLLVSLVGQIGANMTFGSVSEEIYGGGLNKYLVYPASFLSFKYATSLANSLIALGQLVIIMVGVVYYFGVPPEIPMTIGTILLGVATAFYAGILTFIFIATLEMVAFWIDTVWSLNVMLVMCSRILGGGALPLALFPDWLQAILHYLPFPYLMSFPILTVMGKVTPAAWVEGMIITTVWMVILTTCNRLVWWRGNLRYTGVGV